MPVREQRKFPASIPNIMNGYASSESSASPRDLSPLVSGTDLIGTMPASPTMVQNISDAALSSPDDSMYGVALHKASLLKSWTHDWDPELKELLILQKLLLLQFVLQHQRDQS